MQDLIAGYDNMLRGFNTNFFPVFFFNAQHLERVDRVKPLIVDILNSGHL